MCKRQTVENIIIEYIKPVYGFALKRTTNNQDAEDLTQEIIEKLYRSLIIRDDIEFIDRFVWTVAKHTLANYYRSKTRINIGINIDDICEILPGGSPLPLEEIIAAEDICRLKQEIAYLSKMQRKVIILYYYENKKQSEIAQLLGIPLGTVKWHLNEAKTELKKGMEKMRQDSKLKFNPIKFDIFGMCGSSGTLGKPSNFFRSALSQNITYIIYNESKNIEEISDALGVSPVYVESELEFLIEYGIISRKSGKYLANILIDEANEEQNEAHHELYSKAASLIANELFDRLLNSKLLENSGICYPDGDKNYLMWSLVPYLLAWSSEKESDRKIKFNEVATYRPDGGYNIITACILPNDVNQSWRENKLKNNLQFGSMYGPCWNSDNRLTIWEILGDWTDRTMNEHKYQKQMEQNLKLMGRYLANDLLSSEEYAQLVEQGFIRKYRDVFEPVVVLIKDPESLKILEGICIDVKKQFQKELNELLHPYIRKAVESTPKHLQKMRAFTLQSILDSDGDFLKYSLKELVQTGRLKPVSQELRNSVSMIVVIT